LSGHLRKQRVISSFSRSAAESPAQALESVRKDLEAQLEEARREDPRFVITTISHHLTEWNRKPMVTAIATLDVLSG
jgi:hypothetical protein